MHDVSDDEYRNESEPLHQNVKVNKALKGFASSSTALVDVVYSDVDSDPSDCKNKLSQNHIETDFQFSGLSPARAEQRVFPFEQIDGKVSDDDDDDINNRRNKTNENRSRSSSESSSNSSDKSLHDKSLVAKPIISNSEMQSSIEFVPEVANASTHSFATKQKLENLQTEDVSMNIDTFSNTFSNNSEMQIKSVAAATSSSSSSEDDVSQSAKEAITPAKIASLSINQEKDINKVRLFSLAQFMLITINCYVTFFINMNTKLIATLK